MSHTDAFDALMGDLPGDWSFVECYVALDDPMRLSEARVALARANARPMFEKGDHDFAITIANTQGRGARAGVVRSALKLLDHLGIQGRTWLGETRSQMRPAPAHRFGP